MKDQTALIMVLLTFLFFGTVAAIVQFNEQKIAVTAMQAGLEQCVIQNEMRSITVWQKECKVVDKTIQ